MSLVFSPDRPELAVIVPTLDEAGFVGRCLDSVVAGAGPHRVEVVVADGGSVDGTIAEVEARPWASVVRSVRGRGAQMNAGAAVARACRLLFLHADCLVGEGFAREIVAALCGEGGGRVVGGAFALRIDDPRPMLRVVAQMANARFRVTGIPYGDQGLFVARDAFEAAGGFPAWPILEDLALAGRLRRRGDLAYVTRPPLVTSARRWLTQGIGSTILRHWIIAAGYAAGLSPRWLCRLYPDGGRGQGALVTGRAWRRGSLRPHPGRSGGQGAPL